MVLVSFNSIILYKSRQTRYYYTIHCAHLHYTSLFSDAIAYHQMAPKKFIKKHSQIWHVCKTHISCNLRHTFRQACETTHAWPHMRDHISCNLRHTFRKACETTSSEVHRISGSTCVRHIVGWFFNCWSLGQLWMPSLHQMHRVIFLINGSTCMCLYSSVKLPQIEQRSGAQLHRVYTVYWKPYQMEPYTGSDMQRNTVYIREIIIDTSVYTWYVHTYGVIPGVYKA